MALLIWWRLKSRSFSKLTASNVKNLEKSQFCNMSSVAAPNKEIVLERLQGEQQGITVLGLNRPDALNTFNDALVKAFSNTIASLKRDKATRVLVIRSLTPGVFCAGGDLNQFQKMSEEEVSKFTRSLNKLFISIEQLPMPVIAALDGSTIGGGLEMALACDMRIAAENTKMGLVETRLGIVPGAGGTQRLPRLVSPAVAKELIFTSRIFNGTEAKALGVVNHTVQQNETKDAAYRKAIELAEEIIPNGPIGVRMAKLAIDKGLQADLRAGYSIEEICYSQLIPTKDRLEGLNAFIEKRKPVFKGE